MSHYNDAITKELQHSTASVKRVRQYLVIGLLFFAMVLRMVYGHGLVKKNVDESGRLEFIKTISIQPDNLNIPLGSAASYHPLLSAYITAFGYWLTDGSVYGIRIIYIFFSIFGLLGLFSLTREMFGYHAAIIALFLGATDHHLISYAPEFLEPVYLCLVPWLILSTYRAIELQKANYWIIIGIIGGLGYLCSEIFMLLALSIALTVLSSTKPGNVFKTPQFYIAVLTFFLIIAPNLIWNYGHPEVNIIRHVERITPIGLTPRFFLLYLGDLLINLKTSSDILLGLCNTIYGPWSIPCHWFSGLLYLFSIVYSLKQFRDRRHAVLLLFVFSVGIIITFLNAKEPWNEFEWGAMTIFPAICLTSWTIEQFSRHTSGRVLYVIIFTIISVYTIGFLHGGKCGYASPFWEKRFLGDVIYYSWLKNDHKAASELVEAALAHHPDCAIAHYFRGDLSTDPRQKETSFQKVLALEPFSPLVCVRYAENLMENNKNLEAFRLLSEQVARENDCFLTRLLLYEVTFKLGNYAAAEVHLKRSLEMKPDVLELYQDLFHVIALQGRFEEGLGALERYAMKTGKPDMIYQVESQIFSKLGQYDNAGVLYRKAREKNPDLPVTPSWEIVSPCN